MFVIYVEGEGLPTAGSKTQFDTPGLRVFTVPTTR